MPKYFFFDLDNTLTRSKSHIEPEHIPVLKSLANRAEIIVVSGSTADTITTHLSDALRGEYHVLGQNGNRAQGKDEQIVWERLLSDGQKEAAFAFIRHARRHLPLAVRDENDIVEDRGCQVAFSLIGHHEDIAKKEAFDPDHSIRHGLLRDLADQVSTLESANIEVRSGGTTNLDMFEKGRHKGYNVAAYIAHMRWNPDECIYIGDALFPGGNDETVVGIISTHAVKDYRETYQYLTRLLGISTV